MNREESTMQTKPEAAWNEFVDAAIQPTMPPDNVAALKMAFLAGYVSGLADLGNASLDEHCMPCAWGALIDEAKRANVRQARTVDALRRKHDARAKLN